MRASLNHHHCTGSGGHHNLQLAALPLCVSGVDHELVIHQPDPACPDRAKERDVADGKRGRRADHGQDVRIVVLVGAQDRRDDLHLLNVIFRKQWADGPVNQPHRDYLLGGWPALSLDDSAGELPGGVLHLAVFHSKGKEVLFARGRLRHCG